MHPGMMGWWSRRHREHGGHCGEHAAAGCGPGGGRSERQPSHYTAGADDELGGGAFGVRRPLRFLAWKLELEEPQVAELAKVLNDLKTERAQAAVDTRRSTSAFADAIGAEAFDAERVTEAAQVRVKVAEQLRDAVIRALGRIHAVLDPEQRERLAYLIRTGALSI